MATYLSKNFTLEELIKSDTAARLKIDNTPNDIVVNNLKNLAQKVLQPIRDYINTPIKVNSGYRCEKLNKIVGGKPNSQHKLGEAADIIAHDMPVINFYNIIKNMAEEGKLIVDQCIHEISHEVEWVHISYTTRRQNRNMFLELKV